VRMHLLSLVYLVGKCKNLLKVCLVSVGVVCIIILKHLVLAPVLLLLCHRLERLHKKGSSQLLFYAKQRRSGKTAV
jgi:hypothetical protein